MTSDAITQSIIGSLLAIQAGFLFLFFKRTLGNEKEFSNFKDDLPEKYVPRRELGEIQNRIDVTCGSIQSDIQDSKQALKAIHKETSDGFKRIHERIDVLIENG